MKSFYLVLAVLTATACKMQENHESQTKDFAASSVSPNFGIIAGYGSDKKASPGISADRYNWLNILQRKGMGEAVTAYCSSVKCLTTAFEKVGAVVKADSTITFAFTGQRQGNELKLSDGMITVASLIETLQKSAKTTQLGEIRFYALTDTVDSNKTSPENINFISSTALSPFAYALDFSAQAADATNSASGRLATEFAGALALLSDTNNPTLGTFLQNVQSQIKKANGKAKYRESKPSLGILNQPILSTIQATAYQASASDTTLARSTPTNTGLQELAQILQAGISQAPPPYIPQQTPEFSQQEQQPTNGATGGVVPNAGASNPASADGNTAVTQYSLSFCGPCRSEALRYASDPRFAGATPQCTFKIVIVDNNLSAWNSMVGNDPFIVQHSVVGKDPQGRTSYPQADTSNPACQL